METITNLYLLAAFPLLYFLVALVAITIALWLGKDQLLLYMSRLGASLYYKYLLGDAYKEKSWMIVFNPETGPDSKASSSDYNDLIYALFEKDKVRNTLYENALKKYAKGKTILDIGTGSIAFLSRMSLKAGAKKVYAVEASKKQLQKAKKRLTHSYTSDRITFIHGYSTEILTDNPSFDIILHEIIGCIASDEGCVYALNDAKKRFRHTTTKMIPYIAETAIALSSPLGTPDHDLLYGTLTKIASWVMPNHTYKIYDEKGHYCVYNFPPGRIIRTKIVKDNRKKEKRLEYAVLDHICFADDTLIEEDQYYEYTLEIEQDSAVISGVVLYLLLTCDIDDIPLNSLTDKTNWAPVYIHLYPETRTLRKGDHVRIQTSALLGTLLPEYSINISINEESPRSYSWSGNGGY